MRQLVFLVLIILWSGLAISLMDEPNEPSKNREKNLKTEIKHSYRPQSDRS